MRSVFMLAVLAAMPASSKQVQITVYDKAQIPRKVVEAASDELRRIFRQASIDLELVPGYPGAAEGSLVIYSGQMSPAQQKDAACRARRDIALEIIAAPPGLQGGVLGVSHPWASKGLNVQVFADHISDAALRENCPYATLIAHAIAHELGHVLLRTQAHEMVGIMAGVWTGREYKQMTYGALLFTREQSQRMHATLAGEGCNPAAAVAVRERGETVSNGVE